MEQAPDRGSDDSVDDALTDGAFVSRLSVIEEQPLEARAGAYVQLHDELRARLEGGDSPRTAG